MATPVGPVSLSVGGRTVGTAAEWDVGPDEPPEVAAFWAAIGATPEDGLVRGVFADWLEEREEMVRCGCKGGQVYEMGEGRDGIYRNRWADHKRCSGTGYVSNGYADLAAALRATADREPLVFNYPGDVAHTWWDRQNGRCPEDIPTLLFDQLDPPVDCGWDGAADYPTAEAAIRDLCRAWVATHRAAGTRPDLNAGTAGEG